jgi:uncharacterized membrane protein
MNLAHLHLLLNHFPTVGFAIGMGMFLVAFFGKSEDLQQSSLIILVLITLMTFPIYVTGSAAQRMLTDDSDVSGELITAHQDAALLAFTFLQLTGFAAWFALWQSSQATKHRRWTLFALLGLSITTFVLMARTGYMGGEIRHPEIGTEAAAGAWLNTASIASAVIEYRWAWAILETLHFIGLVMLFIVVVVNLRVLGIMKQVSFPALHRLLPWAIIGFAINSITGMLFFIGAADQYTLNPAFYWKMLFILLAGVNVLYLTVSDEPATLAAGDNACLRAKVIAASGIFLWFGVLFWGRLLPFLGLQF